MIYFTSDTHYSHKNIIKYSNRPFSSVEEMNESLIDNWNKIVKPGDCVYHLGDLGFTKEELMSSIVRRLNGQKFLIFGNHDKNLRKAENVLKYFVWSKDYFELNVQVKGEKQKIVLAHYPFLTWNKSHHGSWHLHGHCHGTLPVNMSAKRIDVGVDCFNYTPVSIDEIGRLMAKRKFEPVDHHGIMDD